MRTRKTAALLLLLAPLLVVVAVRATRGPVLRGALVTARGVVLQRGASDCGLAALATVALHTNVPTASYADLLDRHPPAAGGFNLAALAEIGTEWGIELRPYRMQSTELDRVPLPALLHLSEHHFVVLLQRASTGWYVADPAVGMLRVNQADLERAFSGAALLPAGTQSVEGATGARSDSR